MLFLYSPPRACVVSTRRAVVSILSTLSIFGACCVDAAPLGGAGGGFRLLLHERGGRACDTSNERANAAHAAKEQRGGGLLFSTRRACLCSVVHVVHIRGGLFLLLVWYSLNAATVGVHIVHVVYIRAGCVDAAPAPLSSSFGAFSIRRVRAVVLVSYSLNAGRCHIGRRLGVAPPRRSCLC